MFGTSILFLLYHVHIAVTTGCTLSGKVCLLLALSQGVHIRSTTGHVKGLRASTRPNIDSMAEMLSAGRLVLDLLDGFTRAG